MDKQKLVKELEKIVGAGNLVHQEDELAVYECDGYTIEKSLPDVVVFPQNTEQVSKIVKYANREEVPFIPRGAGTGLSGGCLPVDGGIMIALNRMDRILEVDLENKIAVVEAGVVNLWVTEEVQDRGYLYAPDPSSQQACTIGGNIAENSGGPHTLKYGVTTNHVLGVEMVLPDGKIVHLGGRAVDSPGYDLTGVIVGSEGTFGIVTEAIVRLSRRPEVFRTLLAIFDSVDDASNAVSGIIGRGILPAALEMMDELIIEAVEAAYHFGFPEGAKAALIVELDGLETGIDTLKERVIQIFNENNASKIQVEKDEVERQLLWKSRKGAFGAVGRLSPSYCTQDGVVPRTKLPEVLQEVARIAQKYSLRIANVFHAGDGNLHPIILFDERDEEEVQSVLKAGGEILKVCVDVGGTITGEHGIGIEKVSYMPLIFSDADMEVMKELKAAFNPDGLCNPGKVFPTSKTCGMELQSLRPPAAV